MDWLKLTENYPQPHLTQMWTLPLTIIVYAPSRPPEGCSLKIPANILMVKGLWEAYSKPGCLWHEYQLADCPSQPEGDPGGIHTAHVLVPGSEGGLQKWSTHTHAGVLTLWHLISTICGNSSEGGAVPYLFHRESLLGIVLPEDSTEGSGAMDP